MAALVKTPAGQQGRPSKALTEAGTVAVWRSDRAGGDTKTARSRRTLKLARIAVDALTARKAIQAADRLKAGELWQDKDLVFTTAAGVMLDQRNIRREFRLICKAAGLGTDWVPRELRHTFVSFNAGMSLQALMALLGQVSTEMTLRYASLGAPAIRNAYEEAMNTARARLTLPIAPIGQPIIPGRIEWLRTEMLKTRVAHGYCSRQLAAEACPYANICEQCDNYITAPEFIPPAPGPARRHHRAPRRRHRTRLAHRSRPALPRHRQHPAQLQRLERFPETGHNA